MARKAQTPHSNTLGQALSEIDASVYGWRDLFKPDPYIELLDKKDWRERLCCSLAAWASNEKSIALQGFLIKMHLKRRTFERWVQKYPDIKEAYDEAKLIMAYNREMGTCTKALDGYHTYLNIEDYDPSFTVVLDRAEARKKKDDLKGKCVIVPAEIWKVGITTEEEVSKKSRACHSILATKDPNEISK